MRCLDALCLLASLWLCGCTAPPRSEQLALGDGDEGPRVAWADYAHSPEQSPTPPAPPPPEVSVVPEPLPRAVDRVQPKVSVTFGMDDQIPSMIQDISAVGMPAIDLDTGTVVVPQLQILQLSSLTGWFKVSWLDPFGHEESLDLVIDPEDWSGSFRAARSRLREINAKLRASRWRPMERLAVELPNRDWWDFDLEAPANDRRVQAITQHGELIVRIRGVQVLERHPLDDSRGATLHRVYADRESGTALAIFMECTGDSCTCDPAFTAQVMRFDAATFTWIDRHPCTYCEPTDFGFNDGNPWD